MPKGVTSLNIKNENGSFTNVPIAVKAENVKLNNGKNLEDSVAYLDTEKIDSGIEAPIKTPLYQEDVVDHLYSSSSITPLSAVQGKVLQNEIDTLKTAGTIPSDTLSTEIIDIRNGANGKVYTSAGTAVRSQLSAKEDRSNKVSSKNPITGELLPAGKNEKYPTINFLQQFYYENSQVDELIEQAKNQIGTADWAELKDLRVGADGEQYDNAGLSVRTNIQKVSDKIDELLNSKADKATTLAGYGITDAYTKTEVDTSIDNSTSDLKNVINPQIATATATTTEGTAIMIRVTSGKWLKNSIIRLSIEADDTVINGKVTFGVTYGSENLSNIAVPYVNTQAIYITTDVATRFSCYIAANAVIGNGNITMRVEYLGVLDEIVNLHNSVEDIKKSLTKNPPYNGKTFSIIGDSYSAYMGWIPEGYNSYYGNDDMDTYKSVTSPAHMWWHILSSQLKMPLINNGSWAGTTICTTGYSGADYTKHAFVTRVKSLFGENNTTAVKPDYIFVFGGTNDDWADSPIGELKYSDWATDDLKSVLPAFCYLIDYIKLYNPHATIVNIVNEGMDEAIATGMATACEYYGAVNIELTGIDKLGGHPSATGQSTIAGEIMTVLKSM